MWSLAMLLMFVAVLATAETGLPSCPPGQAYKLPTDTSPGMCQKIWKCPRGKTYDYRAGVCRRCLSKGAWYRDANGYGRCGKTEIKSDYTVTQCVAGGLVLQSTTPDAILPKVGNFIWNPAAVPLSAANICTDCAQFGAVVTSVGAPRDCSTGTASCVEVQVETRPALLSEIFSKDLLSALGVTQAASSTYLDALGCGTAAGRRLTGMTSVGPTRSLLQLSPPGCGGWNVVNSDGRCQYTDCFVGNDPIPSSPNCFGCPANECNNGCGPAGGAISKFIPNSIPFLFDFTEGCCSHDYCYASTSFSKSQCDLAFLNANLADCASRAGTIIRTIKLLLRPSPLSLLTYCPTYALAYYTAVALGGGSAYDSAQDSTKAYEKTDACVAQCPSTQRSGGQGITTLRINMLRKSGTFPVSYQMYTIPDQLDITYEGASIFTTGGLVSGGESTSATFNGQSTIVEVTITAPNDGTAWDVDIGCPSA